MFVSLDTGLAISSRHAHVFQLPGRYLPIHQVRGLFIHSVQNRRSRENYPNGRTEPYCVDSAIGLIPDIIVHLGFGKDLSIYLTISL